VATRTRVTKGARTRSTGSPRSKAAPRVRESVVVYVPGIGRQASLADLKLEWDLAVFGRDLVGQSRMALATDLPMPRGAGLGDGKPGSAFVIDTDDILDRASLGPESTRGRELVDAMVAELGMLDHVRGDGGARDLPVKSARTRSKVNVAFVRDFLAVAAAYFLHEDERRRAQRRVRDVLGSVASHHVAVVAHGFGCVAAYEVIAALGRDGHHIDSLVTLGAPLGLQEVRKRLQVDPPVFPKAIQRWRNFAHPLDVVAAGARLANDFEPRGKIEDELVMSTPAGKAWEFDPHSAIAYLSHPGVRAAICDDMRMDVMGRFVIARDVVERFDAPEEERHPVLIEVLEPGYPALGEEAGELEAVERKERAALKPARGGDAPPLRLEHRIASAAAKLRKIVTDEDAANIDALRRFVAARLTAAELRRVCADHRDLRVYAVWRSAQKKKLTSRSMRPLKCDAGLTSFGADGNGITWAVLDTGILGSHPHFSDTITSVWDCTQRGPPRAVDIAHARDPDGHGTHVAGIIAGKAPRFRTGPQPCERGAAPSAKLVVYKVLDDRGEGEDAWIIKALDHIAEQNENVTGGMAIHGLNLSFGGPFDNTVYGCGFSPICAELRRLWRAGVLVVVACGNEGVMQVTTPDGDIEINSAMSIGDPANLEDCIAVGSVNADRPNLYGVSSFSSRGPTADGRVKPDVVAPGERISSCNARYGGARKDLYYMESGTSMAAPHVSGLLAAFLSVRREFRGRPDEVKEILRKSCIDLGRDRYHQGHGIPNLMQMLLSV
jgi:hypothetical protein